MSFAARLPFVLCLPMFIAPLLSAQTITVSQPTLWASKPDVAAFEKIENDHLAAGRGAIDTLIAVKGPRTAENTLVPYDEAYEEGFEDMPRRVPDTSKINQLVGFKPEMTLDGILETVISFHRGRPSSLDG